MIPLFGAWRKRYTLVGMCFFATFICYIDRVNISVAIIPMAEHLGWDREVQGRVLSAFFVGYLLTQILGGRLADRFGGKVVLGTGVLLWSLFTALTPPAAFLGLGVLFVARIAMGMGEGVTFPSAFTLISRWVPPAERSRAVGLNNSAIPVGTVFALLVTPWVVEAFGWPWAFYLFGSVGLVWYALWQRVIAASPELHPTISAEERKEIEDARGATGEATAAQIPIHKLLGSGAVWAIIVAHFCNNWSLYVLLSWLPTFVNQGLGVDFAAVGVYTMIPHLASFVFLNVAGGVADGMIRKGWDVTKVRKLMQTIGCAGIAAALLIVGEVQTAWMAIAIMVLGNSIGAAVTGGFAGNHMDVAPRYAGTLMGLTNTAGTIPGIIGVYVSGLILEQTGSWALVFQVTAGVTLFGMIFYLIFGTGRRVFD